MTEDEVAPASGIAAPRWRAAVDAVRALPPDAAVLLVCHVNPDGDALGSMLGVGLALRAAGFTRLQATFPGPSTLPVPFRQIPGLELLVDEDDAVAAPDLLMCFDAASPARLGRLAGRLETAGVSVVLDHHASNGGFGTLPLIDPHAAATSVVAAELLRRLDYPLDARIAECLYIALVTDTGSFKFDLTTPAVHELAARLLRTGLRPGEISQRVLDSRPFGAVRLFGDALSRAELEPAAAGGAGLVWAYVTLADLATHRQEPYVMEALIDSVRGAAEADVACVLKQLGEREWSVSLRSKGARDVAAVAVALGGGGHRLAAGFTGRGTRDEVLARLRESLATAS
ncbi:phosphoesterase [Pilimelia terevasa]|uniref:Phosphoesterase n=1 Tax=Pilimelia terevasa TaxID=53372 RepID=A0A8J3BKC0_9ACTN|nr:DHH family phosphoesterase [Pilimelia terevasa]GGK27778.1 phosphoesterase [Pilimelia terevasa]